MIGALARMLRLSPTDAEASMYSERAARAVLSRRDLFAAGGALAAGTAFSFGAPSDDWAAWLYWSDAIDEANRAISYAILGSGLIHRPPDRYLRYHR